MKAAGVGAGILARALELPRLRDLVRTGQLPKLIREQCQFEMNA